MSHIHLSVSHESHKHENNIYIALTAYLLIDKKIDQ